VDVHSAVFVFGSVHGIEFQIRLMTMFFACHSVYVHVICTAQSQYMRYHTSFRCLCLSYPDSVIVLDGFLGTACDGMFGLFVYDSVVCRLTLCPTTVFYLWVFFRRYRFLFDTLLILHVHSLVESPCGVSVVFLSISVHTAVMRHHFALCSRSEIVFVGARFAVIMQFNGVTSCSAVGSTHYHSRNIAISL